MVSDESTYSMVCNNLIALTNYIFIFRVALLGGERREAAQANSRNEVCIREILVFCIKIRDIVSLDIRYKNTIYLEYSDPV